jgi:hypothetical protein
MTVLGPSVLMGLGGDPYLRRGSHGVGRWVGWRWVSGETVWDTGNGIESVSIAGVLHVSTSPTSVESAVPVPG